MRDLPEFLQPLFHDHSSLASGDVLRIGNPTRASVFGVTSTTRLFTQWKRLLKVWRDC